MPNNQQMSSKNEGRGWHGDPVGHAQAGRAGGVAVSKDRSHMAAIGRKGGESVSRDRGHMALIGRKGGEAVSKDRGHMSQIGREGGESRTEQPSRNRNTSSQGRAKR